MYISDKINNLKPIDLNCNVFDVYSYDGLSMQELLCQFFTKINECIKVSNETIDLASWLVNEGLKIEVVEKLMLWLEDGTLEHLINVNLFNTLHSKIENIAINIKDFGAKCDGVTNDTQSFIDAINYTRNNFFIRKIIVNGNCLIDPIDFNLTNVVIEGNGRLIANSNGDYLIKISGSNNTLKNIEIMSPYRINIKKLLLIEGNNNIIDKCRVYNELKSTSTDVIWDFANILVRGNYNVVKNCDVFNGGFGVQISNKNNKVLYNDIHDNICGIRCSSSTRNSELANNNIFNNNVCAKSGADGILCSRNVSKIHIHHNHIEGSGEHGVYFQGDNSIISNNVVVKNNGSGIKLASYTDDLYWHEDENVVTDYVGHNNIVSNNQCNNNSLNGDVYNGGIYLQAPLVYIKVSDNICNENAYGIRGVYTNVSYIMNNLDISNNSCYLNTQSGIEINGNEKIVVNDNKTQSIYISAPSTDKLNIEPLIKGNVIDDSLSVNRSTSSNVINNIFGCFKTSSSSNINFKLNKVTCQNTDFVIDRVLAIDGCDINFVDGCVFSSSRTPHLKQMRNNNFSFEGELPEYLLSSSSTYKLDNLSIINNKFDVKSTTFRILNLFGENLNVSNNTFICSNNTENVMVVNTNNSVISNNTSKGNVSGIWLKGNNNIVCSNLLTVGDNGTNNIVSNNKQ